MLDSQLNGCIFSRSKIVAACIKCTSTDLCGIKIISLSLNGLKFTISMWLDTVCDPFHKFYLIKIFEYLLTVIQFIHLNSHKFNLILSLSISYLYLLDLPHNLKLFASSRFADADGVPTTFTSSRRTLNANIMLRNEYP